MIWVNLPDVAGDPALNENDPTEPLKQNEPQPPEAEEPSMEEPAGEESSRQRILIGSQRDPAANRARQKRDWKPVAGQEDKPPEEKVTEEKVAEEQPKVEPEVAVGQEEPPVEAPQALRFPVPDRRHQLSDDLQDEFDEALADASLDDLMTGGDSSAGEDVLEEEAQLTGRVVAVRREDVFVELGSREQGCVPLKQFEKPPEIGAALEVVVQRLNNEDGLYELSLPAAAVSVGDWSHVKEGMLVEARVTGHNTGGLECEVGHLRGFIPISQIALYRVEDLAEFVDQKFNCLISEANPERRNLVLSRRAVLERDRQEAKEKLLASLEPGQEFEGVVRKLMDFGAFVDIGGGVDGLVHISQLSWDRIDHPSEVLSEGQTIKVKIEKVDQATGKIGLAYRDMLENPWDKAEQKYPTNSVFEGTVTKLMEFGAFVRLEPGVEGLVHISELSHKRIWRASDVVHEGDKVQVMILSVDPNAQRMSLSIRQTVDEPEPVKKEEGAEAGALPEEPTTSHRPDHTLNGGLANPSGGQQFGPKG